MFAVPPYVLAKCDEYWFLRVNRKCYKNACSKNVWHIKLNFRDLAPGVELFAPVREAMATGAYGRMTAPYTTAKQSLLLRSLVLCSTKARETEVAAASVE